MKNTKTPTGLFMNISELNDYVIKKNLEVVKRLQWGEWKYDEGTCELICRRYFVDLEGLVSTGELLDTILQVSNKTWCDDKCLKDFMDALNWLLFPAQKYFCSFGRHEVKVKPRDIIKENIRKARAGE